MRLGRDGTTLLIVICIAGTLGWALHNVQHTASRGEASGASSHVRYVEPEGYGDPAQRAGLSASNTDGGCFPRFSDKHEERRFRALDPNDPMLTSSTFRRFSLDSAISVEVHGKGYLAIEPQGDPSSHALNLATRVTCAIDRNDGDLVARPDEAHMHPKLRIPTRASAYGLTTDGTLIGFVSDSLTGKERALACGQLLIALPANKDAMASATESQGRTLVPEALGLFSYVTPGTRGTETLVIHPAP